MDNIRILLKSIADFEILNLPYVNDLSLYEGKTGRAIFFSLLGTYFRNPGYELISQDILNDVCSNLRCGMTMDFGKGITGIGWGLAFLDYHGFIESDLDEVLFEVDRLIEIQDLSNSTAMANIVGLKKYIDARLCNNRQGVRIFSEAFVSKLSDAINNRSIFSSLETGIKETWKDCIKYYRVTKNESDLWKEGLVILNKI